MTADDSDTEGIECALLWRLARDHGWSKEVDVKRLVSDSNVRDEKRGREVARNQLSENEYVGYHQGKDTIWLDPPPTDELAYHLRDECGFMELQIEATLDSYFDGF